MHRSRNRPRGLAPFPASLTPPPFLRQAPVPEDHLSLQDPLDRAVHVYTGHHRAPLECRRGGRIRGERLDHNALARLVKEYVMSHREQVALYRDYKTSLLKLFPVRLFAVSQYDPYRDYKTNLLKLAAEYVYAVPYIP